MGPPDASTDGSVAQADAGSDAGSSSPITDAAVAPEQDAQVPVSCDVDSGIGMPLHGAPCTPGRCDFVMVVDCAASCNTCSDGIARWVTSCGLPIR